MSKPHGLFSYPPQATVGKALPKSKVYEHAKPGSVLRALFVSQVEQISWAYKLAPETINLPATSAVPEIQIFDLLLKMPKLDNAVLRCIDKSIPFPILFQLRFDGRMQAVAAHKRPSDANASQWIISDYFVGPWEPETRVRPALPIALDLGGLYERLLRPLMPVPVRAGETLRDHLDRATLLLAKQDEAEKLAERLARAKQFNRKVELNAQLRTIRKELNNLSA